MNANTLQSAKMCWIIVVDLTFVAIEGKKFDNPQERGEKYIAKRRNLEGQWSWKGGSLVFSSVFRWVVF